MQELDYTWNWLECVQFLKDMFLEAKTDSDILDSGLVAMFGMCVWLTTDIGLPPEFVKLVHGRPHKYIISTLGIDIMILDPLSTERFMTGSGRKIKPIEWKQEMIAEICKTLMMH